MSAYYNEFDPKAAAWLRELIKRGRIADGEVDTRSIEDVTPDDLRKFTQCHFFAGIGVWSYALRRAGWPDDRPVWTASCPCQPFSAAGKGDGFADERHLWPAFYHLVRQCRPATIFGEQVASKDGLAWLDLVHADLEGTGYSVGALDLCAAGFGAPHIRQRIFFVADAERGSAERLGHELGSEAGSVQGRAREQRVRDDAWDGGHNGVALGDTEYKGSQGRLSGRQDSERQDQYGHSGRDGATNGFWHPADWLPCRDGKWRPVEPGTFPLAHGAPARVGRLRGYGNAIVAPVAQGFIKAYLDL